MISRVEPFLVRSSVSLISGLSRYVEPVVSQERTEAVVLRGVDYSETSRIVTFLSPDRGRLTCMAKGVRRKNSPLSVVIDTFNRVEAVYYWKDGRGIQLLAEASLLDGFGPLKADLEKAAFASLPLEIAYRVAHENEPSYALYATLVRGFESLCVWPGEARAHVCWQVIQLLIAAGFEPTLTSCVECGQVVSDRSDVVGFSYKGGVTCPDCGSDARLTSGQYVGLLELAGNRDVCPRIDDVSGLYPILCRLAVRQLDTDFRSVRVIDEMFGRIK